jgi:hypothetical protein
MSIVMTDLILAENLFFSYASMEALAQGQFHFYPPLNFLSCA